MSNVVEDGLRTLSVRQLGAAMNLPSWRIYQMIRDGAAPPYFRIGATYRFRAKAVDEWITQQSNNQKAQS